MDRPTELSLKDVGLGVAGGLVGAAAMTAIMLAGERIGAVKEPMPHRMWRNIESRLGLGGKTDRQQERILGQVMHFVIGSGYGVLYGLTSPLLRLPGLLYGSLFGLGSYVMDEVVMGPALSITPPPTKEPERRVVRRVLMHLVFGLALSAVVDGLRERL